VFRLKKLGRTKEEGKGAAGEEIVKVPSKIFAKTKKKKKNWKLYHRMVSPEKLLSPGRKQGTLPRRVKTRGG